MATVSVIIPTLNEAENLPQLLDYLQNIPNQSLAEIIVADGGSTDATCRIAMEYNATLLACPRTGRAAQMNYGVQQATGKVLQFIHADTQPPASNFHDIIEALQEGFEIGCFTYRFDSNHPLLRINSWFTHLHPLWCRGGDQAIFITRRLFNQLGGYKAHWKIMEEYDLLQRARQHTSFKIIRKDGLVSARKYKGRNYLQVQVANFIVFNMFLRGCSQEQLVRTYKRLLG